MRSEKFPVRITEKGVSAIIRESSKSKGGKIHKYFIIEYILLGKRKQVWRSDFTAAKAIAQEACIKIANGQQSKIELSDSERFAYIRAIEILSPTHVPIDSACREFSDALKILDGKASITEVCRDWIKRHTTSLPRITVEVACMQLQRQALADGKSQSWIKLLGKVLNRFSNSLCCEVHTLTPKLIAEYLTALKMSERSKRNHRDVIGFFNRWLILNGYLSKGTNLLEGVQTYSARKLGEIEIYTPDELRLLLGIADKRLVPFLAIGAFAGLRHAEIARLDWSEIELMDVQGESFIEVRAEKAKTQTRRLIPVKDNLKAWLIPYKQNMGKVCSFVNISKQLQKLAKRAQIVWKRNALRHSCISYRIAESGDAPRVSEESGNSVQIIRSNYLRWVKPAAAAEWFSIVPPTQIVDQVPLP